MSKCILLLSGGLDSTLAGKMMLEMGVEVKAVSFTSPFCNCTPRGMGCSAATKAADQIGIPVTHVAVAEDYLEVMKHPRHGRGSGVNACIDCRIHMFRKAKAMMVEEGADFIVTGEVLGQRPMSQRRNAMETIEKNAGLEGLIVRPLSAQLLPPSKAEADGLIDRDKLLAIQNRSRKPQIEMAEAMGLEYLCPAGGCLLTDKEFAARFRDLEEHQPDFGLAEARLLRWGRQFRLPSGGKALVARDARESDILEKTKGDGMAVLLPAAMMGPTVLVPTPHKDEDVQIAARLLVHYTKKRTGPIDVELRKDEAVTILSRVEPVREEEAATWRIGIDK